MPAAELRILVPTRAIPTHAGSGGMERAAWDLMCAWQAAGHTVICATTPTAAASTAADRDRPAPVSVDPVVPAPGADGRSPTVLRLPGRPGSYSRAWFAAVAEAAARLQPDIIFGVSAGAHSIVGGAACRPGRFRSTDRARGGGRSRGGGQSRGGGRARGGGQFRDGGQFRGGGRGSEPGPLTAAPTPPPVVMQAHGTSLNEIRAALAAHSLRGLARAVRQVPGLLTDLRRYRRYDAVVAIGDNVAAGIAELPAPVRPRRLDVIANGIRLDAPPPCGEPAAERRGLVFVGRMLPEKGPDLACQVAAQLGAPITLLGDGQMLDQLRTAYPQARIRGACSPTEVAAELQRARALLVTSQRREGLPLVVLEALANGCPAVVTAQTAAAFPDATVPAGVHIATTASGAERTGPTDFAAAARPLLAGPPTAVTLPAEFGLDSVADRYIELFTELIADRHEGRGRVRREDRDESRGADRVDGRGADRGGREEDSR